MSQMFHIGYDHCCMLRHIWKYNWNASWYFIYVTNVSHRLWSLNITSHVHVSMTSYPHMSYALLRLYICSFAIIYLLFCKYRHMRIWRQKSTYEDTITSYALLRLYICSFASIATAGCVIFRCIGLFFGHTGLFRDYIGLFCVNRNHRMYHLQIYRALVWTHRALLRIYDAFADIKGSFAREHV